MVVLTGLEIEGTVQFYSVDFQVLSLDGQDLTSLGLGKINIHVIKRADGEVCFFIALKIHAVPVT